MLQVLSPLFWSGRPLACAVIVDPSVKDEEFFRGEPGPLALLVLSAKS